MYPNLVVINPISGGARLPALLAARVLAMNILGTSATIFIASLASLHELPGMLNDAMAHGLHSTSPRPPATFRSVYVTGDHPCDANQTSVVCRAGLGCCGNFGLLPNSASLIAEYIQHFIVRGNATYQRAVADEQSEVVRRAERATCFERGLPNCTTSSKIPNIYCSSRLAVGIGASGGESCTSGISNSILYLDSEDSSRFGNGQMVLRRKHRNSLHLHLTFSNIWDAYVPVLMGELGVGPKVQAMWLPGFRAVHVFERWESLLVHSSEALPGVVDDLIRRTYALARAGLYCTDVKITDIVVRRQAGGAWECSLSDFDAPYCGTATATPDTLVFMTLLPMALRFACFDRNWRLPLAADIVRAVLTLNYDNQPRNEDFAGAQLFAIWAKKVAEARAIFRRHYDRNATKTTTGKIILGLCARLAARGV